MRTVFYNVIFNLPYTYGLKLILYKLPTKLTVKIDIETNSTTIFIQFLNYCRLLYKFKFSHIYSLIY